MEGKGTFWKARRHAASCKTVQRIRAPATVALVHCARRRRVWVRLAGVLVVLWVPPGPLRSREPAHDQPHDDRDQQTAEKTARVPEHGASVPRAVVAVNVRAVQAPPQSPLLTFNTLVEFEQQSMTLFNGPERRAVQLAPNVIIPHPPPEMDGLRKGRKSKTRYDRATPGRTVWMLSC